MELFLEADGKPTGLLIILICVVVSFLIMAYFRIAMGYRTEQTTELIDDDADQFSEESEVSRDAHVEPRVDPRLITTYKPEPPIDRPLPPPPAVLIAPIQQLIDVDENPAGLPISVDPGLTLRQLLDAKPIATEMPKPKAIQFWFGEQDGKPILHKLDHFRFARKTGGGKCLGADEFVFLSDGQTVRARDLVGRAEYVIGLEDLSSMRQRPVLASFEDNGVRNIVRIKLDNGVVLTRTLEHPLWAGRLHQRQDCGRIDKNLRDRPDRPSPRLRVTESGWVNAGDIRLSGTRPSYTGHVILCPKSLMQVGTKRVPDSDVILCAVLLAEGGLTGRDVRFTSGDRGIIDLMSRAAAAYSCSLRHSDEYTHIIRMNAEIKHVKQPKHPIRLKLIEWRMWGKLSTEKVIPDWVYTLPDSQVAAFLRIMIDCDGWIDEGKNSAPRVNISLASEAMVRQIAQLAMRLGITGTIRYKDNDHAGAWTWSTPQVVEWYNRIGVDVKAHKLDMSVESYRVRKELAATDWNEWRNARPVESQTFSDCPEGYEWRKVVGLEYGEEATVSITVHNDNHAFVGYAVEHNSHILIRIICQLLAQGVEVWYINPKYMPKDQNDPLHINLDPVIKRCTRIAIGTDGKDALRLLEEAARDVEQRVLTSRDEPDVLFALRIIIIDELSLLESKWKKMQDMGITGYDQARTRGVYAIDHILRAGRQPGVFYGATSQDAQVQNSPTNSGVAGNFGMQAGHPSLDGHSLKHIFGDKSDVAKLPPLQGEYDWWVVTTNPLGADIVSRLTVPALSNDWIAEQLATVPERNVEDQIAKIDSGQNRSPKLTKLAEQILAERAVVLEQAVPAHQEAKIDGTPEPHGTGSKQTDRNMEPTLDEDVPIAEQPKRWTDDHLKVYAWIQAEPSISQREVAKRLWNKWEGRWNGRAGQLMADVRIMKELS